MYNEIFFKENPEILVITPLRETDSISIETLKSLSKTRVSFHWISYKSSDSCPGNAQRGLEEYQNRYSLPKYIIKLDNDVSLNEYFLDKLYLVLEDAGKNISYCYPNLSYYGRINLKIPAKDFSKKELKKGNYITSNSLIKSKDLLEIGGFVRDKEYIRLADWALWLTFLNKDKIGIPCKEAFLSSPITENSISAGSREEYIRVKNRIEKDLIPFL